MSRPAPGSHDPTCEVDEHAPRGAGPSVTTEEAFERAASLFRTAGDPARLRLLERLAEREWCVTELAEAAGTGLSTVSQQLRLLRAERIVTRRRVGKHIYYSLTDAHVRELIKNALAHASERRSSAGDDDDGR